MYRLFVIFWCATWLLLLTSCFSQAEKNPTNHQENPVASSIKPRNHISAFVQFTSAVEQNMLTIPADKHFLLTDIIGMASIEIKQENKQEKETKLKTRLGYSPGQKTMLPNSLSLQTGIVFNPGTKVVVYPYPVGTGLSSSYGYITLSGYFF